MKTLVLMRHAKAQPTSGSGGDFDRALSERGPEDARLVATALKRYGIRPDLALVSPARRTRETFAALSTVMGSLPAEFHDTLYDADSETLRDNYEAHAAVSETLLIIAHNPGLQYLAAELLRVGAAGADICERIEQGFPTAAACVFQFNQDRPVYDGFYVPKDLIRA